LTDARVDGLSTDRRFIIACEAAVALATIPLCASGFRTEGIGHHHTTFLTLPLVMGEDMADLASYFDACRAKRNLSAYDRTGGTSETEVEDILAAVTELRGEGPRMADDHAP
jgi:hypothetical protein